MGSGWSDVLTHANALQSRRGTCQRVLVFRSDAEIGAGESVLNDLESAVFCRSSVHIQDTARACD